MNEEEKRVLKGVDRFKATYPTFYKVIKIVVVGLIVYPVIIWSAYFLADNGFVLIRTSLGVGDAFGFYGSILAFIGTVLLGALALWQNNKLNKINNDLVQQQYKPIITVSPLLNITDEMEKFRTFYRTVHRNENGILINSGYSSEQTYYPYTILSIKNIGLGPAVKIEIFWYNLDSVKGLNSLEEIKEKSIDNFYDKISYSDFEYSENNLIKRKPWLLFTEFDLGISEEANRLNLLFTFEENTKSLYSIIEIQYENLLGIKHKKLMYLNYANRESSMLPVSKEYIVGGF